MRHYSPFDHFITQLDNAVRTVLNTPTTTGRADPADAQPAADLTAQERRHAAGLMRVDHAGEVAAQALYQGQARTARLPAVREKMECAAAEENDHLAWCARRVTELGSHTSLLNPLWYAGSFAIGALAGAVGDRWSLGFVAETERQVVKHLDEHLRTLPAADAKSRAILEHMRRDELQHATTAQAAGGAALPPPVKLAMGLTSKLMTKTAYWV